MAGYLSYTGFKSYAACPKSYWYKYVSKPALGRPENRVNSLYGTTVGYLFEWFYNERIWNTTGIEKQLNDRVMTAYLKAVDKEQRDGVILWKPEDTKANYKNPDEMLDDVRKTIPRGIRIIRHHRLLGQDAVAEVPLNQDVEGHTLGGRCDLLMRRIGPHHDLILLDGKGSKYGGMYTDALQLKWYSMLYRLKHKFKPDRLGFVFWRFEPRGEDGSETGKSVKWVDCSNNELDELLASVLGIVRHIEEGKVRVAADPSSLSEFFPAHPGDACRFCPYFQLCTEGQKYDALIVPEHVGTGVEDVGL
jgi:hypothetical protein